MRVICIESSTFLTGSNQGKMAIHKGAIYHVTNVLQGGEGGEVHKLVDIPGGHPELGDWYELLEANGYHHSSRFLEIPSDLDEYLEYTKQQEDEKISNEKE